MATPTKGKKNVPDRLIREFNEYGGDTLTDYLSILARDIEDAMIQCGATPGKDYAFLDVFQLAVQLAAKDSKTKK